MIILFLFYCTNVVWPCILFYVTYVLKYVQVDVGLHSFRKNSMLPLHEINEFLRFYLKLFFLKYVIDDFHEKNHTKLKMFVQDVDV